MITKQPAFFIDDKIFRTFEDAQRAELETVLKEFLPEEDRAAKAAIWLLERRGAFIDILTMTPRSRAKARKIDGATKKKSAKATVPLPTEA